MLNMFWIYETHKTWVILSNTGRGKPHQTENVVSLCLYRGRLAGRRVAELLKKNHKKGTRRKSKKSQMLWMLRSSGVRCVTWFCCTGCRSWRRCWTRAAESVAGTGPGGTASEGWSRGSGWPEWNRCAEYSQWRSKLRNRSTFTGVSSLNNQTLTFMLFSMDISDISEGFCVKVRRN